MADKSWDDQYISKTDAIKLAIISVVPYTNSFNIHDCQRSFEKTIGDFTPSVDVQPVVHGKWVDGDVDGIGACGIEYRYKKCSICDYEYSFPIKYNFCPNCGARMDNNEIFGG